MGALLPLQVVRVLHRDLAAVDRLSGVAAVRVGFGASVALDELLQPRGQFFAAFFLFGFHSDHLTAIVPLRGGCYAPQTRSFARQSLLCGGVFQALFCLLQSLPVM